MDDEPDGPDDAPGWDAIDEALRPIYGDRKPYHVGTVLPYCFGGSDPIHGISAYKNAEPTFNWHFVTYGFSELWAKESKDRDVSGYGFELTYRSVCTARQRKPPNWALNFLQNLGRYVFKTGNKFGTGHTLPLNGPIEQGSSTLIHAVTFCHDPQLPPIATPNGDVEFLQIVGLTIDELEAISSWNASAFLRLRARSDPLLLTDLGRKSWFKDRGFANEVSRLTKEEGSSCGWMSLVLECDTNSVPVFIFVQTIAVDGLKRRLLSRLPYGREFVLNGKADTVVFKPGKKSQVSIKEGAVTLTLRPDHLTQFAESLQPHAGSYLVPGVKDVAMLVVKTEIKDRDGNVVEVVE